MVTKLPDFVGFITRNPLPTILAVKGTHSQAALTKVHPIG